MTGNSFHGIIRMYPIRMCPIFDESEAMQVAKDQRNGTTREKIIETANRLFLDEGYTRTPMSRIAKELGISTGNLTFHFPTKEHLLLELVKVMCRLQGEMTLGAARETDISPLLAYALEITLQTALCERSEIARDFYVSAYTHPLTLTEIRTWDFHKASELFGEYNPNWTEDDFRRTEDIASGIEVAVLMTPCEDKITLDEKIACTLHNLMKIYNVPDTASNRVIEQVLAIDYLTLSEVLLQQYRENLNCAEGDELALSYENLLVREEGLA